MQIPVSNSRGGNPEEGFTLIELSIVLVIIGLIVGGILVGQDMIKAAEIRGTISQIQKYDAAINTFRNKYGYIPGDLPATNATNLGFFSMTTATQGFGDGNGMLEGGAAGGATFKGETSAFWRHMSDASLIDGLYGSTASGQALNPVDGTPTANLTASNIGAVLPPAKMGRGNYLTVYSANGTNYFEITGATAIVTAGTYTLGYQMTPQEGATIDQKLDDGLPLSGSVQAMNSTTVPGTAATAGATSCVFTGGTQYNTTTPTLANTIGATTGCQLSIRFN